MQITHLKSRLAWLLLQWGLAGFIAVEGMQSAKVSAWIIAAAFVLFGVSAFLNVIPLSGATPMRAVLLDERYRRMAAQVSGASISLLFIGMLLRYVFNL